MNPSLAVYVGEHVVIVAPRHVTADGILYEQDAPIVLRTVTPESVGTAIKKAFAAFSPREKNLRDLKRSDWPAFKVSGAKSIKQFEREFFPVSVSHLNPFGTFARADLPIRGDEDFQVSTIFNPHLPDAVIGTRILALAQRMRRVNG